MCAMLRVVAVAGATAGADGAASDAGEYTFVADVDVACEAGCAGADVRWLALRCSREAGLFMASFPL